MNFDAIHNYYENLVINQLMTTVAERGLAFEEDFLQDAACVALNQLPARYVRHDVDMAFYLTAAERAQIDDQVRTATEDAVTFVARYREENARAEAARE